MFENEFLIIFDKMAELVDRTYDLPKDCPEIKDSEIYKGIIEDADNLMDYMEKCTKEINQLADQLDNDTDTFVDEMVKDLNGIRNDN